MQMHSDMECLINERKKKAFGSEKCMNKIKQESGELGKTLANKDAEISALKIQNEKLKFDTNLLSNKLTEFKKIELERDRLSTT